MADKKVEDKKVETKAPPPDPNDRPTGEHSRRP